MLKLIGIALGAGVTSALLFTVTATASSAGLLLAYLAPLPLMIAGLGFSHLAGALAALIGGGTVGRGEVSAPGLTPEEVACVRSRLESLRFTQPIENAPLTVSGSITLNQGS